MTRRRALIVGTKRYDNSALARIRAAEHDVDGLHAVLGDSRIGGFAIEPILDMSERLVRRSIEQFLLAAQPDETVLLYLSGHGLLDERGSLHIAAKDTHPRLLASTSIPADFIKAQLDRSRARAQVLIVDCCYSGAVLRGAKSSALDVPVDTLRAFEGHSESGAGRVILTASDSTQLAWEGDHFIGTAKPSFFTHHLIEGLRTGDADSNGDGIITVDEWYDYAYERVHPNQTPKRLIHAHGAPILIARVVRPAAAPAVADPSATPVRPLAEVVKPFEDEPEVDHYEPGLEERLKNEGCPKCSGRLTFEEEGIDFDDDRHRHGWRVRCPSCGWNIWLIRGMDMVAFGIASSGVWVPDHDDEPPA